MISDPAPMYVMTLRRPQSRDVDGRLLHPHLAPEVSEVRGDPEGALIASPEKALFDVFYLSGTKPRTRRSRRSSCRRVRLRM
jgi:hypothetical protein